jgi:hypothetical protein
MYIIACNKDVRDDIGVHGKIQELLHLIVYTWQDCIAACADWTEKYPTSQCYGVTFLASISESIQAHGGNCFLKNDTLGQGRVGQPLDNAISLYVPSYQ